MAGGLTLWHHHSCGNKKQEFSKEGISYTKKPAPSTEIQFIEASAENVTLINSTLKKNNFIPGSKQESKKIKVALSPQPYFADPKKPAPTGKYKFTISQVNTMAIVSFLLIPVMILGFFIPGGLGAAIAITALIIGVGLAIFSLAIGAKRRGVWAPGIAAGFWLVLLVYLSLLIFLF